MKVGILGGGLTGLTIASQLSPDIDCEVLEAQPECGGLCRSIQEQGFTFDIHGAHIIYSKNQQTLDFIANLLGDNAHRGRRNNKIYYGGRLVKYPFENGLAELDKQDNLECLRDYLIAYFSDTGKEGWKRDFKTWILETFGGGIADKYLFPYNEKIWKYPLNKMSAHWMERIPQPPLDDVLKSAIGILTEGYTHQLNFLYPLQGGIQALTGRLTEGVKCTVNFKIAEVYKSNWIVSGWTASTGLARRTYDVLISTIPLLVLIETLPKVPAQVKEAAKALKYNSLVTIMLGYDMPFPMDYTAIYFPNEGFLPHRIAFPGNFSPNNVPAGKSSIVAEITCHEGDVVWGMNDDTLVKLVANGIASYGLGRADKVIYFKVTRAKYGYVIYDLEWQKNIKVVRDWVESQGIILCGRFAEWEYYNMDTCIEHGIAVAKELNGCLVK